VKWGTHMRVWGRQGKKKETTNARVRLKSARRVVKTRNTGMLPLKDRKKGDARGGVQPGPPHGGKREWYKVHVLKLRTKPPAKQEGTGK